MNGIRIPNDWRWGRVRADVDAGRLWKARDRLQGCLRAEPANQDVLDMLGAVWFAMGDLPQAGRHWWLTEREDEQRPRLEPRSTSASVIEHTRSFGRCPGPPGRSTTRSPSAAGSRTW